MARSLRIEYPGALYHVLNRGNYRRNLFDVHLTAEAFEKTLFETAERFGWIIHAYVVMSNHYHIALETPRANLSAGMHFLQSVFANRFNRFCGELGHVFQGRYKALIVQPGPSLVRVVDYIHLNPVRAHIVPLQHLDHHKRGSFPKWFQRKSQRPACLADERWRQFAGYRQGERELRRYWADLALKRECQPEEHERLLQELCSGWFIGAREWAIEILEQFESKKGLRLDAYCQKDESEKSWEELVQHLLNKGGYTGDDLINSRKSAAWKLELASTIKARSGVTNAWLAKRLNLGNPTRASHQIKLWRAKT